MTQDFSFRDTVDISASLAFASAKARAERLNERRVREHHSIWDNVARQRAAQEEPRLAAAPSTSMDPFSHIKVVHRQREEEQDDGGGSPQTVFRRPSFSQQVQTGLIQPGVGVRAGGDVPSSSARTSLANLTSGTTFAAAARQAELNAARASKLKAKEAEREYEAPAREPVALGALKFTTSRRRGGSRTRAWKTSDLDDIPDVVEDENAIQHPSASKVKTELPNNDRHSLPLGTQEQGNQGTRTANERKRADTVDPHGPYQMPTAPYEKRVSSIKTSFSPSVHALFDSIKWDPDAPSFKPSAMASEMPPNGGNKLNENVSTYPRDLYRRPSGMDLKAPPTPATAFQGTQIHSDDPFTDQVNQLALRTAQANRQPSGPSIGDAGQKPRLPSGQSQTHQSQQQLRPSGQQTSLPVQKQPLPTVKGTMDYNFRFPPSIQPSVNPQSLSSHANLTTEAKSTMRPAVPKPLSKVASVNAYQRDPKPYSSFSATSKKEMLLQNLDEMVKVEKEKGKLPASTRTVLYDPVARQAESQSRASNTHYRGHSELDKESLKLSEPLPWKDRPVDIFNPLYNNQDWREAPSFPPGLAQGNEYIYSLAQQPKPVERSLDDLQRWWTTDNRAQHLSLMHIDQINEAQRKLHMTPSRRGIGNPMEPLNTPPSGRTESSMPAIGSERSSMKAASAGSSINSEGMAQLLKAALINLQSYVDGAANEDYFGRFARVPEWCIDKSPGGNDSFFGDWGSPPSRVGRDPRYRPTYHEGRYTVFEELDRRGGREIMGRRLR
ncbi:MAG: hypothetical protein Q9195_009303 [Heterodermia aff. obscurata]